MMIVDEARRSSPGPKKKQHMSISNNNITTMRVVFLREWLETQMPYHGPDAARAVAIGIQDSSLTGHCCPTFIKSKVEPIR